MRSLLLLTLAATPLLSGCASEEQAPPPPPPTNTRPADPPVAAPATKAASAEMMVLKVQKADLATVVLPEFERQVNVKIIWLGDPRPVTLRLTQPVHWQEALKLVCQFTKTHLTTDYQGRKVLKDGWGGELGDGDIDSLQRSGRGSISSSTSGRSGGGAGGGSQPAWNGGGSSQGGGGGSSAIPQPTGAYSGGSEAGALLRGVGMNSSNGGNQPR